MLRFLSGTALLLGLSAPLLAVCPTNLPPRVAPDSRYSLSEPVVGQVVVTDLQTGLQWKQCSEGQSGTTCSSGSATLNNQTGALAAANASTFAGHNDWRLPNAIELYSLVETSCHSPSINTWAFPNTGNGGHWSSSTRAISDDLGWAVSFGPGNLFSGGKASNGHFIRLVRGGQGLDAFDTTADFTPDAFSFAAQTDVPTSSVRTSDPITVAGITTTTGVGVSGASSSSYSINGGAYTSLPAAVRNGDQVRVRHTSSATPGTATTTTLTIGGVTADFVSTTNAGADLSINDVPITEGNASTSNATFTVTRTNNSSAFSVPYSVTAGTAQAGSDYTATSGSLNFAVGGALMQTIEVPVVGDLIVEATEMATLNLGTVTNITGVTTVTDGSGLLTITDNDSAVVAFNPVSVSQTEATTPMAFTVTLSNPVQSGVTLVLNSGFGSATMADFTTIVGGAVSFPANSSTSQIVNVTINNDALDEDDESFTLTLSGLTAVGNVTLGTAVATGTILDDDQQLTTTTISSDLPDASVVGQPYAVVVDVDAVTLSPMGTVTVSDGSVSCGPVALVPGTAPNSSASCQLTSTTAGTKTLMATYAAASGAFAASSSTTAHQVNAASTAISVVGEARSRVNQPTTFTFAFSVEAPGAGTPAGTVTLSSGASTCNVTVPTGTASCALTFTALGARTVSTAFVPADGNFLGSSSSGPGNAQTLVFARSDLAVSNSNGINAYEPGDLIVYTVSVTNLGPDAAAQIRVRDTMPAGLIDVVWSCIANGGVLCPESGGVGDLDVVSTGFPVGGLLDFTFSGNVDGSPPQLINTALVELPADTTIEDLVPGNNSATDVDLLDGLFADGFESAAINASSAR